MELSVDTVASLLAKFEDGALVDEVQRLYKEDLQNDYRDALLNIRQLLPSTRNDDMCVVLSSADEWNASQGFEVDVHGQQLSDPQLWSLSCTPWRDWLAMPVSVKTKAPLTHIEVAAHILYEMTWGGWSEDDVTEKREMINERMEDVMEAIETGDTSAFVTIDLPKPN